VYDSRGRESSAGRGSQIDGVPPPPLVLYVRRRHAQVRRLHIQVREILKC
jgi:hypothetical protein